MQLKKWVKLQIIVWNVKISWSILELLSRIIKRHAAYVEKAFEEMFAV